MKSYLSAFLLIMLFCTNLFAQGSVTDNEKDVDARLGTMFDTKVIFDKPSEAFTEIRGQDGYEEAESNSKIVAMFLPVEYGVILEDFQQAKANDDKVKDSGTIPYGDKTGYYNQIDIPAPKDLEQGDFVGIIAILPVEGGTINLSALCPKKKAEDYLPLYLKVMKTARVQE